MAAIHVPAEDDNVFWENTSWLSAYPLTAYTALDYFSNSIFYDLQSINERAKRQRPPVAPQDFQ